MPVGFLLDSFDRYSGGRSPVIIAVSGGGDSMALLDLYQAARRQNAELPVPYVISVDHGLRTDFAREAALVTTYCANHALPWEMAVWQGVKPKTGIMAAARLARYRLLSEAARAHGAIVVLTGHTLDDQTETGVMRAKRGAVTANFMESDVLFERRIMISRPVLSVSRADLRAHLVRNNIAFADDPSNTDIRFERARVRLDKLGLFKNVTLQPVKEREALAVQAANFIDRHVHRDNDQILISRPAEQQSEGQIFALRYLAAALGGFAYPASRAVAQRMIGLLDAGQNGQAYTAQRCKFTRCANGILATRDQRHANLPWLEGTISPFETLCAKSLLPLANALAKTLGAPAFNWPPAAAI